MYGTFFLDSGRYRGCQTDSHQWNFLATLKNSHFFLVELRKFRVTGNTLVAKKKNQLLHWYLGDILVIFLQPSAKA